MEELNVMKWNAAGLKTYNQHSGIKEWNSLWRKQRKSTISSINSSTTKKENISFIGVDSLIVMKWIGEQ